MNKKKNLLYGHCSYTIIKINIISNYIRDITKYMSYISRHMKVTILVFVVFITATLTMDKSILVNSLHVSLS